MATFDVNRYFCRKEDYNNMPIITLTSDWGNTDYTAAAVKGHILSKMPEAVIVDISHNVEPFNRQMAAYLLKNAYSNFPDGTVHIIGVNTTESKECKHVVVQFNNHFFIGADNGIPALIVDKDLPQKIIELSVPLDSYKFTFSERDLFAKVAVHITSGLPLNELGTPLNSLYIGSWFAPQANDSKIYGTIVYSDNYGNIVTNISEELFKTYCKGKKFEINLQINYKITEISTSYDDVKKQDPVAVFNSDGYLEIGLNQGDLFHLFNYEINDQIIITMNETI